MYYYCNSVFHVSIYVLCMALQEETGSYIHVITHAIRESRSVYRLCIRESVDSLCRDETDAPMA